MKRFHVNFQKLLDGLYSLEEELLILEWMLQTARPQSGRIGVDQLFYGYSAYNHESKTNLLNCDEKYMNFSNKLELGFFRAIVKTGCENVKKWREENNIYLNATKRLPLNIKGISSSKINDCFFKIKDSIGKTFSNGFSNEHARGGKIRNVLFSCDSHGFVIEIYYGWDKYPHSGWDVEYRPKGYNQATRRFDGEAFADFLNRVADDIENNTENCFKKSAQIYIVTK